MFRKGEEKMNKFANNLEICEHKCWCKLCKKPIIEGTKFLIFTAYRLRINICYKCLIEIGDLVSKEKETFDCLSKMPTKERKEKLKLTKFLGDKE